MAGRAPVSPKIGHSKPGISPARPDAQPIEEQVRLRAYELYLRRGGTDGNEMDDWLQAEADVKTGKDLEARTAG